MRAATPDSVDIREDRVVGRRGFEPLKRYRDGFTARPLWPLRNLPDDLRLATESELQDQSEKSELAVGIEPTTFRLQGGSSAVELR